MNTGLRRLIAVLTLQLTVFFVLCWSSLYRSYSTRAVEWTLLLALCFAFFFALMHAVSGKTEENLPWS